MNTKTYIYTGAIIGIFLQMCVFCLSLIALIIALIINDAIYTLLSIILLGVSILGVWVLLKTWKKMPNNVLNRKSAQLARKRGGKKQ